MKIISHRGASFHAPENTMPAFIHAIKLGAHAVELDIRRTMDNKVVIAHDLTFNRVMCGANNIERNNIHEMTLDEVTKIKLPYAAHVQNYLPQEGFKDENHFYLPWFLDNPQEILQTYNNALIKSKDISNHEEKTTFIANYFYRKYKKEYQKAFSLDNRFATVPSLEEFFVWLKNEDNCEFVEIEFKDKGIIAEVDRLIRKYDVSDKCILFSGVLEYNEEIQNYYKHNAKPKDLRLGANIRYVNADTLDMIKSWDLYEVGLNAGTFTEKEVSLLHQIGIKVFANIGDYPQWMDEMKKLNISGFKTNFIKF